MRYRFISQNSKQFHIVVMCKVLKVSKSGYYQWAIAANRKDAQEEMLCSKVLAIFKNSGIGTAAEEFADRCEENAYTAAGGVYARLCVSLG